MTYKLIISVGAIIALTACTVTGTTFEIGIESPAPPTPIPVPTGDDLGQPTEQSGDIPVGWQTYTNTELAVSLSYPAEWTIQNNLPTQPITFWKPEKLVQPQSRAEVSLWGGTSADPFMMQALAMQPGDQLAPDPIPFGGPQYHSHSYIDSITIGNYQGVIIQNDNLWEAPPEMHHRRIILTNRSRYVELSAFYMTEDELAIFQQILASMQLD